MSADHPAPKVSVCLVTYNQEALVSQAVESVLAQRTSFAIELVIGEDHSTDGTRDVVRAFARQHPDRVRVLLQRVNRGLLANFSDTFAACRGEYVALLDGDDYWTSPDKLEKQARFLDGHPACTICFHDTAVLLQDGRFCPENYTSPDQRPLSTITDLFETNFIATCSAMVRRSAVPALPSWYYDCCWEDWPLYILLATRGSIGYLPEVMAVYRSHGQGLWSGLGVAEQLERTIDFLTRIDGHLDRRHSAAIHASILKHRTRLAAVRASERACS